MRTVRGAVAAAILVGGSHATLAQDAQQLARLQTAIVRISSSRAGTGSGIVVDITGDLVRIITARHVIEGDVVHAVGTTSEQRPCDQVTLTVAFKYAPESAIPVERATCNDVADFAVIEIRAAVSADSFPHMRQPADLSGLSQSRVYFLGVPEGRWSQSLDNTVLWNSATTDATADELATVGAGVVFGYSGGAMLDTHLGLAGMIVRTNGKNAFALRWLSIEGILRRWKLSANLLEGASTGVQNPAFRNDALVDYDNESARNAIRAYHRALTGKIRPALLAVYPSLGVASVDALFGDAITITLKLSDCTDLDIANHNTISCLYAMEVARRTARRSQIFESGPPKAPPKDGSRMVFTLKQGDPLWHVAKIEVVP